MSLLVGCGEAAIEPLRDYLLRGEPRCIFQPRQRAVDALIQLGAKAVLIEYLSQRRTIPDFEVRFAEEAVENTAARGLAQWLREDVFRFLCDLADRRMLTGVVETLGRFERPEAAPILIRALGDSVCHTVADEALRKIADEVKPLLLTVATHLSPEYEKPSERQRRRFIVRILSDLALSARDWEILRPLLKSEDKTIARTVAQVAVDRAPEGERREAARFLIHSLGGAPWFEQTRIQECLERNYSAVCDVIEHEDALRRETITGSPLADPVTRILEKVRATHLEPRGNRENRHGE